MRSARRAVPANYNCLWLERLGTDLAWTEAAGETRWYLYDLDRQNIVEEAAGILPAIGSTPETPRRCAIEQETLAEIRQKIEKHVKNTFLKPMQAPLGVKPILKAWMELM